MCEEQEILLAHVTHAPQWDLPKGCADPGESPREAAVREAREETGLKLAGTPLRDLGQLQYQPRKNLHLFALKLPRTSIDPSRCRCSTKFTDRAGRDWLEVDAYRWVPFQEVARHCTPRMSKVLLEHVGLDTLHSALPVYQGVIQEASTGKAGRRRPRESMGSARS